VGLLNNQKKANIIMVIVTFFWGLSYVFMKMGLDSLQVFNIIFLRFILAFIIAGILFYKQLLKVKMKTLISSFKLATLLFGVFASVTYGVSMTSASKAGFLVSLTVIFVPLFNTIFVKRLPSWPICAGLVLTMTGIGLLTLKHSFSINPGDLLCIVCAVFYASHIILTGKLTKDDDSLALGIFQLGFVGLLALIFSLIFEKPSLPSTINAWVAILGLGIFCSAIGFVCQTLAQKYTTPLHIGLIFALEPIFAALSAVIFLREIFTVRDLIGCSITILGILIAQMDWKVLFKPKLEKSIES
jgi:drug/metabolite transporter (DMT)-like permease